MKKTFILLSVLLVGFVFAANAVDLSGKWKLNASKSKLGEQFSMAPKEIVTVQSGNDLSVEKKSAFQDQEFTSTEKYTLDGKECTNAGFGDSQRKSTAVWSDDKSSLKITSKMSFGENEMTITEVYKLTDGNLVIESSTSSSFGENKETQVYDKQ